MKQLSLLHHSDDSFDGFKPQDVDDAKTKKCMERHFWNRLGPFWGEISETMTCKSGYLWTTRSYFSAFNRDDTIQSVREGPEDPIQEPVERGTMMLYMTH